MIHCVKCCSKCIYTYRRWMCNCGAGTGWRRLIGYPKLQVIFHKRATKYRSLLRKMIYQDKGSYESSPPCTAVANSMQSQHSREMHPLVRLVGFIYWSPCLLIIYICIKQGCCASTAVTNWTQIQLKDTFPRATYMKKWAHVAMMCLSIYGTIRVFPFCTAVRGAVTTPTAQITATYMYFQHDKYSYF